MGQEVCPATGLSELDRYVFALGVGLVTEPVKHLRRIDMGGAGYATGVSIPKTSLSIRQSHREAATSVMSTPSTSKTSLLWRKILKISWILMSCRNSRVLRHTRSLELP